MEKAVRIALTILFVATSLWAQTPQGGNQNVPVYRVEVVGRTIKAVNYRPLGGSTKIAFRGTSLMATASGKATVSNRQSVTYVQVEFRDLKPPSTFGPEYLTYVLWAITPDGHPTNVAEVIPHDGKATIEATVNLQAFGMVVTAEPYFAVRMPSDVVVLENEVTKDTVGKIEEVDAKYQLLQRGGYIQTVARNEVQPRQISPKVPLALYEAENAVQIAGWAGAEQHASDTYQKAQQLLKQAQDYEARKAGNKPVIMTAREAVQTAEDARTIAIRTAQEQEAAQERQAAAERTARAQAQAQQAAQAQAQAEQAQQQAQAQAEQQRQQAEAEQQRLQQQAEQQRQQAEQARQQAQQAQQRAQQAETEKTQMRDRLLQQLNSILQTRQTNRGLVVTMSQVLFETGQATLHGQTRETLAKVAGVLLTYPGVKVEVDGYTDNTGGEEVNQELSEKRADAVDSFLVQQGLPAGTVTAHGFGESNPVAPNDTAMGRAMNRRVEIVVSGDVIGIPVSSPTASR